MSSIRYNTKICRCEYLEPQVKELTEQVSQLRDVVLSLQGNLNSERVMRKASTLHMEVYKNNAKGVKYAIKKLDCDPNAILNYCTPLQAAIKGGRIDAMNALLKLLTPEQVNTKDIDGETALHYVVTCNQPDAIVPLLQKGANIEAKNNQEDTPLHLAVTHYDAEMIEMLNQNNANIEAKDDEGLTPLHLAAKDGVTEAVDLLVRYNADVDATDNQRDTPLVLAPRNHYLDLAGRLANNYNAHTAGNQE